MIEKPLLYTSPGSQHCRRVTLLIHEARLEVETKIVDVRPPGMGGENESDAFLALNPNAKVPVLKHGDSTVLTESNAIMAYLCELYGDTQLWPSDTTERAKVMAWQFWQAAHLSPTADALMVENMMKPMFGQDPDEEKLQELTVNFHRWASVLDIRLGQHNFLVGDSLTCADLCVVSALMYEHAARLPIQEHKATATWVKRLQSRPSWKATQPPPMPTDI